MKTVLRTLLLALLLAALPLRGYASVLMVLCDSHHGGVAAVEGQAQERGDSHHHDADPNAGEETSGPSHAASVCSACATCCASASIAPDANIGVVFQSPASSRIPFFGRQVPGFVPGHLDRPPLSL
ncbi:MAG: hypothetical protein ABI654_10530 [Betaproteobacteria bacterium]